MRNPKPGAKTLAAELDRTKWDYNPATDRSFLLGSVKRMFASVAWETTPRHLTPATVVATAEKTTKGSGDFETRPLPFVQRLVTGNPED